MQSDKHILILSSWYPTKDKPFLGNFVKRQAELLAQTIKVTVVHVAPGNIEDSTHSKNGNFEEIIQYFNHGGNRFQRYLNKRRTFRQVIEQLSGITHIHAHATFNNGSLFLLAKEHFNCSLIITEHGSVFSKENRKNWSLRKKLLFKKVSAKVDQLVAVSEFLKNDISAVYPNFIQVIGNHIDLELFNLNSSIAKDKNFSYLHISTLDAVKNPKGIIDAFGIVIKEKPNSSLTIVSDESYSELKKYASSKGINNILFCGPHSWKEVATFYNKAHAFVLNSNYESFSIVLAEAWASGIPVISTPVGIASDLKPTLGLQVKIDNSKDLAHKMIQLQEEYNNYIPEQIRDFAMEFGPLEISNQLLHLYE